MRSREAASAGSAPVSEFKNHLAAARLRNSKNEFKNALTFKTALKSEFKDALTAARLHAAGHCAAPGQCYPAISLPAKFLPHCSCTATRSIFIFLCVAAAALLRGAPRRRRLPRPARLPPGAVAAAGGLGGGAAAAPLRFPALPRRDAQLHRPEVRHAGRLGAAAVGRGFFIRVQKKTWRG